MTLDPDEVHSDQIDAALPVWLQTMADRVCQAAASGKTVTLSAEELMLTPQQMAQRLNMSRTTVLRKIATGEINAVKVGNRHRIPYTEFNRFREARWDQMMALVAPDIEAELFGEDSD